MATIAPVSIAEYLNTTYNPDREYVDGLILERNVGEWDHSWLQGEVLFTGKLFWRPLGFLVMPELRVQVKPSRYRVSDIAVLRGNPRQQVVTQPPFICIEVLSPDDSMSSMQEKIDDYLGFGIENIWIIDPSRRKAFWVDSTGVHEATNGILNTADPSLSLDLTSLWPS